MTDYQKLKEIIDEIDVLIKNEVTSSNAEFQAWKASRVVIIAEHGVELPSDMQGIVYTDKSNWEIDVLKELKEMGYSIDFNKLF